MTFGSTYSIYFIQSIPSDIDHWSNLDQYASSGVKIISKIHETSNLIFTCLLYKEVSEISIFSDFFRYFPDVQEAISLVVSDVVVEIMV